MRVRKNGDGTKLRQGRFNKLHKLVNIDITIAVAIEEVAWLILCSLVIVLAERC